MTDLTESGPGTRWCALPCVAKKRSIDGDNAWREEEKRRKEKKDRKSFCFGGRVGFFCRTGITAFLFLEDCLIGLVCFGVDSV